MPKNLHCWIIVAVVFCIISPLMADDILFVRENIDVVILPPDTVKVVGEYFFRTMQPQTQATRLYYPFPVDSAESYPCSIAITEGRFFKPIAFDKQDEGILFPVNCKSGDTAEVIISYKQKVSKPSGRYILTTTKAWGRPLVNSRYSVSLPQSLTLAYLSYECDTVLTCGNNLVYRFFKKRFMPERDLSFSWVNPSLPSRSTQ